MVTNSTITFTLAGFSWPAAQYSSTVVSEKLGFLNELAASYCIAPCSYFIFDDKLSIAGVAYKPKPRRSETVLHIIRRPKEWWKPVSLLLLLSLVSFYENSTLKSSRIWCKTITYQVKLLIDQICYQCTICVGTQAIKELNLLGCVTYFIKNNFSNYQKYLSFCHWAIKISSNRYTLCAGHIL